MFRLRSRGSSSEALIFIAVVARNSAASSAGSIS
jgi:hypothetical protein